MTAPRRLTAREIASLVGGQVEGPAEATVIGVAPLDRAGPDDLSFLVSGRYLQYFQHTNAGAVLVAPEFRTVRGGPATRILVDDPQRALAHLLPQWYPAEAVRWGVDATARIGRETRWVGRLSLGAGAVIGARVHLGADCRIESFAVVGDEVRLGDHCVIESGAIVNGGTELGNNVRIRSGARIGGPGFRFHREQAAHKRLVHAGRCVLEDDVDVGSNSTIDRGSVADTVVGAGTKIDSQVHVGHNVRIGARCLIMAQAGIAGSTVVEDDVVLAGQAGLAGHLRVGAGARIAAQAGVIGNVDAGTTVSGYPARAHRDVLRQAAALKKLAPLARRLEELARE